MPAVTFYLRVASMLVAVVASAALARDDVLILGGAGKHGSAVAKILLDRGDRVAVLVRPTTNRSRLEGLDVDYVVADAMNAAEVAAALNGKRYSIVFETIQVYPGTGHRAKLRETLPGHHAAGAAHGRPAVPRAWRRLRRPPGQGLSAQPAVA